MAKDDAIKFFIEPQLKAFEIEKRCSYKIIAALGEKLKCPIAKPKTTTQEWRQATFTTLLEQAIKLAHARQPARGSRQSSRPGCVRIVHFIYYKQLCKLYTGISCATQDDPASVLRS